MSASATEAKLWAAEVAAKVPPPPLSPAASHSDSVALYIDASRSMMGFAGCSLHPTHFNTILDELTSDLSLARVVRFGERRKGSGDVFESVAMTKAVHCPGFYDRIQNPDYDLYQAVWDDSTGSTFLYLTDGVQSDWLGRNPGPSIGLLKRWLTQGRALAILAYRSDFAGAAWSEQAQRMLTTVTTDRRPFYLFVLAPSEGAIDSVLAKLSAATTASARVIRFPPNGARCTIKGASSLTKIAEQVDPPMAFIRYAQLKPGGALIDYECVLRSDYPLDNAQPQIAARYRSWGGSSFEPPRPPNGNFILTPTAAQAGSRGATTVVTGTIPLDAAVGYGMYELEAGAIPGSLRPWVDSLSTDSDVRPDEFDRTYRFSWLIEQLARVHLARQPHSAFALTVRYN